MTSVTTWSLEMRDRSWLRAAGPTGEALVVLRAEIACPELNRFLYTAVGGDWWWTDRLDWTYKRWLAYLDRPELETWVGYVAGTPAGYFELERQDGGDVEIAYFGLLPQFAGRGLGGRLLTVAAERAWEIGASRVWVHTCSLDAPYALANYRARGFRAFKTETREQVLPGATPGPWPDAGRPVR
jgi:ribosomal protein S18 acetylase RimI-like enzyme